MEVGSRKGHGRKLCGSEVGERLSELGKSADGTTVAYLSFGYGDGGLGDVGVLSEYVHLESVDLHGNELVEVEALGAMPYLTTLDVGGNRLAEFLDFAPPPHGLTAVNYASNALTRLPSALAQLHPCLTTVVLDCNSVADLAPLGGLPKLAILSLKHNAVESLDGLADLPALKELYLASNRLQSLAGLDNLPALELLDVANNALTTLRGWDPVLPFLFELNARGNFIKDVEDVGQLSSLPLLRRVGLEDNPMTASDEYRSRVVFLVPHLAFLDASPVSAEEKVAVVNMYEPPEQVLAYRKHCLEYDAMLADHLSLPPPLPEPNLNAPAIWDGEIRIASASSFASSDSSAE